MKCYVVSVHSGREESVSKVLKERIHQSEYQSCFGDVIVPSEMVIEMRGGKKRKAKRKFFPGYMLVQMDLNENTWHLVRSTPQVTGFIGGSPGQPEPLSSQEAEKIYQLIKSGAEAPNPRSMLEPGEVVRIIDGPFNDFSATVEEVNYEKNRLKVSLSVLGRSTSLELELTQVEKA